MKILVASFSAVALLLALPVFAAPQTLTVQVMSTSTPPPSIPSGGGGGGSTVRSETGVTLNGKAYPLSKVTVLKDGSIAATTIAGPDASFSVTLRRISSGTHTISVYSEDAAGRRSTLFSFPLMVTSGATTAVSGVYLSPTIDVDKLQVKRGDPIAIFGRSAPSSTVTIDVHSDTQLVRTTRSDGQGVYLYYLDSSPLEMGNHEAQSKTLTDSLLTPQSERVGFAVGTQNIAKSAPVEVADSCLRADINCDGRVNLVDYSILAYWYRRVGELPTQVDVNSDGVVTLADFSIVAYHWTG